MFLFMEYGTGVLKRDRELRRASLLNFKLPGNAITGGMPG
jgi:hypothetical protein